MAIIFFLFFFMGTAKNQWNDYQTNVYFKESDTLPGADSAWRGDTENNTGTGVPGESQDEAIEQYGCDVIYLGNPDADAAGDTIRQWGLYSKRTIRSYTSLTEWPGLEEETPEVLLINPDYLEASKDGKILRELAERGVPMVFCHLPEPDVLQANRLLRDILGIKRKVSDSCRLEGIKLFGGFLLGGDAEYIAQGDEEEKRQDMDLETPWYQLGSGTKTYMAGVLDEAQMETVKNEQLPALIWRASYEDAKVFAINGTYLEDISGVGILSAMMAELHSYELYPVVNAQSLAIINAPDLTPENAETMNQIYSRSSRMLLRDVVFPGIAATSEVSDFPMTGLMTLKLDSADPGQPIPGDLEYYLKFLNEQSAEMGISLLSGGKESLTFRADELSIFLAENGIRYTCGVLYAEAEKLTEAAALLQEKETIPALSTVNTVISEDTGPYDLLDYIDDTTTIQGRTNDGSRHTYMDDFRLRALETGLGYSNIFLDLKRVVYPETEEDRWENLATEFSSNVNTYWKPFQAFDRVVLSESDRRMRSFLALDYTDSRAGDTIELEITGFRDDAWFVLRTHGETIDQTEGASWKKIEEDAYLLTVMEPHVTIVLKQVRTPYYYDNDK